MTTLMIRIDADLQTERKLASFLKEHNIEFCLYRRSGGFTEIDTYPADFYAQNAVLRWLVENRQV